MLLLGLLPLNLRLSLGLLLFRLLNLLPLLLTLRLPNPGLSLLVFSLLLSHLLLMSLNFWPLLILLLSLMS
jgi:hypothetical protein